MHSEEVSDELSPANEVRRLQLQLPRGMLPRGLRRMRPGLLQARPEVAPRQLLTIRPVRAHGRAWQNAAMSKANVLVLCTGNSCRSQMAEGWIRQLAPDRFEVHSAGTKPADRVHPLAVQVMAEIGIDIGEQHPKDVKQYLGRLPVRHLLIVCASADEECPRIFPGMMNRHFIPFDDPAALEGSPGELL